MTTTNKLEITCPSDTEFLMTRNFQAPVNLVYLYLTDREKLKDWMSDEKCMKLTVETDLRITGAWSWTFDMGEGGVHQMFGQYLEIEPGRRIVQTYMYNVPEIREAASTQTMEFSEANGVTTVRVLVRHLTKENRDGHLGSGVEQGVKSFFDNLEAVLAKLQ